MLALTLYNIFTDDQPLRKNARQFIYADDSVVVAQGKGFEEVEIKQSGGFE